MSSIYYKTTLKKSLRALNDQHVNRKNW